MTSLFKINSKLLFLIIITFLISIVLVMLGKEEVVSWVNLNLESLINYSAVNPLLMKIYFFVIYIFLTSLSLPVAFILGLLSGMLFDISHAVLIVSFASSIGATLAFLLSRFLFKDYFQGTFSSQYEKINKGFMRNGAYYLYALRMIPVFPYFIINLTFGLTTMRTGIFYIVTQIGMLPMTLLIILMGKEMLNILTTDVAINSDIIILLLLLGLLPLMFKYFMRKYL
ncbi:VTT domain-containing protein [Gammaproteobacteria bacterium]|nr:VTT domain-containing protein [Gammaproteobacteria bacterium]